LPEAVPPATPNTMGFGFMPEIYQSAGELPNGLAR